MAATDLLELLEREHPNTVVERQRQYSLKDAYKTIAWVYACVNLIGDCISGVKYYFYSGDQFADPDDRTIITDPAHPVNVLFSPPKEGEIHTVSELIKMQFLHMGLFGESFMTFTGPKKKPYDVELLNPLFMTPAISNDGKSIKHWEYQRPTMSGGGAPPERIDPKDLVQWKYPNPYSIFRGMAPLTAARMAIEQDMNMSTWNSGFFQGGVRNPIALLLKQTFNDSQRKEFVNRLRQNFSGFVKGQLPLLVEGGVDVKVLANTIKDLDFVEGKSLTREELCAVYNVPPAQVGIFRYANYANSKEQRNILYLNTLRPKMAYYRDVMQTMILNRFFPGVYCDFKWDEVDAFREDPKDTAATVKLQAEAAKILFDMQYTQAQIAEILGNNKFDQGGFPPPPPVVVAPSPVGGSPVSPKKPAKTPAAEPVPAKASEFKSSKSKSRFHIYPTSDELITYAVDTFKGLEPLTKRFEGFVRSYSAQFSAARVKTPSATFWEQQWSNGVSPIVSEAFNSGFISVHKDLGVPNPEPPVLNDDYGVLHKRLSAIPAGLVKAVQKDRKAALDLAAQLPEKISSKKWIGRFYNLGRDVAMGTLEVERHAWAWGGDKEHADLNGQQAGLGEEFGISGLLFPGSEQHPEGPKRQTSGVCTCTTFPTLIRQETVEAIVSK